MPAFTSRIDTNAEAFAENRREMLALVDYLHALKDRTRQASERRRAVFEERGQLTPRERVARLLDPGMPFLELFGMANYLVDTKDPKKSLPGANTIAGIGFVSGTRCMIYASDSGINAGASTPKSGEKLRACLDIARDKKLFELSLVTRPAYHDTNVDLRAQKMHVGGYADNTDARLQRAMSRWRA